MDVCLKDKLILCRCFVKTSNLNLQGHIVILRKIDYLDMHHVSRSLHVDLYQFQQTQVSRSVQTVHTTIFANNRKLHKFATSNSNF